MTPLTRARGSQKTPLQLRDCHYCDFSGGYRGMDRCGKCDGTGRQWFWNGQWFGTDKAKAEAAAQEGSA